MTVTIRPTLPSLGAFRRSLSTSAAALGLGLAVLLTPLPQAGMAQTFGPVIRVNDLVVTQYELDQRAMLLQLLGTPGDPTQVAREQLVDDRLKLQAAKTAGIAPSEEEIQAGMDDFASRGSLDTNGLLNALQQAGVADQTFRDFIRANVAWRQVVRARFAPKVQVSEEEIDRAIRNQARPGGLRVLMSEIFVPLQPDPGRAQALAEQISRITSIEAFADAARQFSAAQSAANGGRVDPVDLSTLPPFLQTTLTGMAPGDVTPPIPVEGAFAIFQLRAMQEAGAPQTTYSAIDYVMYYVDGANTEAGLARMQKVAQQVVTCDDFYGVAKGQPPQVLERQSLAPSQIPQDVALELAKLDDDEVSTALRRNGGQTGVVLMLCGRVPTGTPADDEIDRAEVANALRNRRLASYADGYLAQLRSEARIVE